MSLTIICLMSLALVGGILAYFSDKETVSKNILQAGTLDLEVEADFSSIPINLQNLAPGNKGRAGSWTLKNVGSIPGILTISVGQVINYENECVEPEKEGDCQSNGTCGNQDTTCQELEGELGDYLKLAFWIDVDKDGKWSSGDYFLKSDGTRVSWEGGNDLPQEAYDFVNSYSEKAWADLQTIDGGKEGGNFQVEYFLPENVGNIVQSDSTAFDITLVLNQAI